MNYVRGCTPTVHGCHTHISFSNPLCTVADICTSKAESSQENGEYHQKTINQQTRGFCQTHMIWINMNQQTCADTLKIQWNLKIVSPNQQSAAACTVPGTTSYHKSCFILEAGGKHPQSAWIRECSCNFLRKPAWWYSCCGSRIVFLFHVLRWAFPIASPNGRGSWTWNRSWGVESNFILAHISANTSVHDCIILYTWNWNIHVPAADYVP